MRSVPCIERGDMERQCKVLFLLPVVSCNSAIQDNISIMPRAGRRASLLADNAVHIRSLDGNPAALAVLRAVPKLSRGSLTGLRQGCLWLCHTNCTVCSLASSKTGSNRATPPALANWQRCSGTRVRPSGMILPPTIL